jgi:hypothetical protein
VTVASHGLRARGPLLGCDVIRLGALVSVVVGLLDHGAVAGALFFLVLGGTMIPRALGAPPALDASYCISLLFAGWAAVLDWYLHVAWLDVVVHVTVTGLVAAMVHLMLVRVGALPRPDAASLATPRLGAALVTATLGVTLALLWELGEWFGHTYLDPRIQVGYTDTVGDLTSGAVGAVAAGVLLARGLLSAGESR